MINMFKNFNADDLKRIKYFAVFNKSNVDDPLIYKLFCEICLLPYTKEIDKQDFYEEKFRLEKEMCLIVPLINGTYYAILNEHSESFDIEYNLKESEMVNSIEQDLSLHKNTVNGVVTDVENYYRELIYLHFDERKKEMIYSYISDDTENMPF